MPMRFTFSTAARFLGLCTFALAALGCQAGVNSQLALAELSTSCRINSDCAALLICAFQRCHEACVTSRDCRDQARCVGGEQASHVCQLNQEQSCTASGACTGAEVCAADAQCRDGCASNRDCVAGQLCVRGTCADPSELDAQGALPGSNSSVSAPAPCAFNSDCTGELVCVAGLCRTECATDLDCPSQRTCKNARCQAAPAATSGCFYNSECGPTERCLAGACVALPAAAACQFDSDCPKPGQRCTSGACACECSVDADCTGSFTCQAGCACVPSRVIEGDVTVSTVAQLKQLDDVREVTGKLVLGIHSPAIAPYPLPTLKTVGSLALDPTTTLAKVSYALEALQDAGSIRCSTCALPVLKTARSLSSSTGGGSQTTLQFPELSSVDSFTLEGDSSVITVLAPKLAKVVTLIVSDNAALTTLDFPALRSADQLLVTHNGALSRCAADALRDALTAGAGMLTNTGNLACSCAGAACCAGPVCL